MNERTTTELSILHEDRNRRVEIVIRRALHALRDEIILRGVKPDTPVDDVRAVFTMRAGEVLMPLFAIADAMLELRPLLNDLRVDDPLQRYVVDRLKELIDTRLRAEWEERLSR